MNDTRTRVRVISLGGTIASTGAGEGAVPRLEASAFVDLVAARRPDVILEALALRLKASAALDFTDVIELAAAVRRALDEGCAGVVVTQGTDTMEESAFALDLLIDDERPVVVTGSMRTPLEAGADGPANLVAAVSVAASPAARGLGTVVVMNDQVHAARLVRKTHATNPATFTSPGAGPLGWVAEDVVRIALRPGAWTARPHAPRTAVPPVALLSSALGDDARLVDAVVGAGYHGLVLEAFGAGHVHPDALARLARALEVMPVVFASRTGSGAPLRATYGFVGSERDLLGLGLVSAGTLDARKARVLLSLLLAGGADRDDVTRTFAALDDALSHAPAHD